MSYLLFHLLFTSLSVSNDLIHSTLTSPGLFEGPTFTSGFAAPFGTNENDQSDVIPHQSLLTSSNHGNEEVCSTSPSMILPQVCVEDEHVSRSCMSGDDSTLKANDIHGFPNGSSDEEEDKRSSDHNGKQSDAFMTSPLSSKSAPSFHSLEAQSEETVTEEVLSTPTKMSKSYSTPSTAQLVDKDGFGAEDLLSEQIDEEDENETEDGGTLKTKSAVFLSSPTASPDHDPSTPSGSPAIHRKTHQKSFSISNVPFEIEKEEDSLPIPDDSRSRGSSFMSSSSKIDSTDTSDYSEDDDFEPPATENTVLLGLKKVLENEDDTLSSEDDHHDGEFHIKGRKNRRLSEVRVTMIDDFSGSEEDSSAHFRPLPRSSTADDALSHSSEDHKHTSDGPLSSHSDVKNDVKIESLNNSFSNEYSSKSTVAMGTSPVFNRDSKKDSFTPNGSPGVRRGHYDVTDPKRTVKHLQTLLKIDNEDIPVFESGGFSDDSEREGTMPRKSKKSKSLCQTLPSGSPHRSPILSLGESNEHIKVSRNASTASDSRVSYKKEAQFSSLDFVKPREGQLSPRSMRHSHGDVANLNPPHSPLFFSKRSPSRNSEDRTMEGLLNSPKSHGSPLEKRVSRSADDLLSESKEDEQKQEGESPSKAKKKEDNSVRLLRFEPLPEDEANTDEETNNQVRKDLRLYYGIEQEKEQPKKGAFKLFRRDSKKDKKPKKYDTSVSIDAGNGKSKVQQSPNLRKPRSNTIHGDGSYLPLNEDFSKPSSKRASQATVIKQTAPQRDSISPVREESVSPTSVSPSEMGNTGEVELDKSLSIKIEDFPELMPSEEADVSWNRTVDRRLRKQMSKHEKGRQGVIYDWITTERHIYRAYMILKKVFYEKFKSELKMPEDELNQLFPGLHTLLSISQEFLQRLQDRQRQSGALIQDISDILLDQFTGKKGETMKNAYANFICLYPTTMEVYRDMEKKRQKFNRFITVIYQNKVCERKKLPDFYLLITQRVSKYVEMMKKLVKETEALKLDHLSRVKESSVALTNLVDSIDQGVYEYTNRKELADIQSRLEVTLPKSNIKNKKKKGIKMLDFTVQNRFLLKRGEATWQGHGKQIGIINHK